MIFMLFLACQTGDNKLADDNDGDGYSAFDGDCNDSDPNSTIQSEDQDCDGIRTEDDCDDNDPNSLHHEIDADCDGVENRRRLR